MKLALPLALVFMTGMHAADAPLDDAFLRTYSETRGFSLGRPANIKPTPDGKHVLFLRSAARNPKRSLFEFDVATGKSRELLTADTLLKGAEEKLTPEEKARRERMRVSAGGFADFHLNEAGTHLLLPLSGKLFVFDRKDASVRELAIPPGTILDPKWSPDGKLVGYVRDHDVYAFDLAAGKEIAVTKGGTEIKPHGEAEFVAQEEMGRMSGYWWSPDSKRIAFTETDHTGVEQWFVADPAKPDQKPLPQYYPRPGKKNVAVKLGIATLGGGDPVWVEWDKGQYEYLAAVKWAKQGPLTIQVQDRRQRELRLMLVDSVAGKTHALHGDRDDSFTNIRQDYPRWLPENNEFIWVEETAKGLILLRHMGTGQPIEVVVPESEGLIAVVHVDAKRGEVAYVASTNTSEAHVYLRPYFPGPRAVRPWSDKSVRLGEGQGIESVVFSENKELYVLTTTSLGGMPRSRVHTREKFVGELPSVAEEPNFKPTAVVEKLGDSQTTIVRPRDFDAKKKYPVLLDVYGGPHHLHVVQAMRNWLVPQYLADQGFIVVAVENRGTPGRGRDWERAIYQKFGSVPLDDQVKGLQLLGAKHPEMDLTRVGVMGWSFGGYMAALSVLKRPDVFKAAVAGAPVTDWEDYDTHYTERYMGVLPDDKKAYEESSLLPLASKLERPLLLVHGTADDNVYYRHTLRLSDALIRAGRDFETMPLPGITHMVTADPVVYQRYMRRSVTFFKQHLR